MREIVFDTETTGFQFHEGDRLVEIGCVELVNKVETGRTFHAYFNPRRSMPAAAAAVHGLTDAFLADKPHFEHGVDLLIEFLGDAPLVAHNAEFDFSFLNGELGQCGRDPLCLSRMIDTLAIAKARHPGAKHTLDALCSRYGVDRSHRVLHGALLDAQLLAQVYVELSGGRQIGLGLVADAAPAAAVATAMPAAAARPVRRPRHFAPSAGELAAHRAFLSRISDPLWGAEASG
jgi:DNA polymerase III subunit epsilon